MHAERDDQWAHYWRLLNGGLASMTLAEFKDEMDLLGDMTSDPVLKRACAKALGRYDHLSIVRTAATAG